MQIYNLLNTNKTFPDAIQATDIHDNIEPRALVKLLNDTLKQHNKHLNNTIYTNPEYLGRGINGELYKVRMGTGTDSTKEYICKVITYNTAHVKQLRRELGLLKTIQSHPIIQEYINPCIQLFIRETDTPVIISIFPVFNGLTLTNIIHLIMGPDFNAIYRILLIKYIIKELLEAVYFFHKLNVSHMQLDTESILIELRNPKDLDLARNDYKAEYSEVTENEDIPISKRERFIPTNMNIYNVEFSTDDKPMQIKFTNFGIGCGKLTEYDTVHPGYNPRVNATTIPLKEDGIHTNRNLGRAKFQQCSVHSEIGSGINGDYNNAHVIKFDKDPYIQDYMRTQLQIDPANMANVKNSKQLYVAKMYDIWLIGMVILQLILKPEVFAKVSAGEKQIHDITAADLHDGGKTLGIYLSMLQKYILCPVNKRRNLKFVQEMIMLAEKHD